MNPLSIDLGNGLLARHKRLCSTFKGSAKDVSPDLIEEATIGYTRLLAQIGAPESLARCIGPYLEEVAAWCQTKNLPPINALAINESFGTPGAGYYTAPGSHGDWESEVRETIACKGYPPSISN
jgi:hypothetical protein